MIRKLQSLITAEAVLNMLINEERIEGLRAIAGCYQNGREHGYIIWGIDNDKSRTAYYICEGRRTDEICIYKGSYAMQGISEDAYKHPNYFGRDFDSACDWLVNELKPYLTCTSTTE